jgi:uncharacterized membrane protein YebE (DUF533 family)
MVERRQGMLDPEYRRRTKVDAEALIGSLIRGTLTGRRKRGHGALRYLAGGGNSFLNAGTLLTIAGLAWGALESAGGQTTVAGGGSQWGGGRPGGGPRPPLNPSTETPLPPLPADTPRPDSQSASSQALEPGVLRIVRLIVSAARADGSLSASEKEVILSHARAAGAENVIGVELATSHPLAEIVAGVSDPQARQDLYALAFTVVHADEGVSGAERIYLAQLANYLDIDADTASRLEKTAADGIAGALGA